MHFVQNYHNIISVLFIETSETHELFAPYSTEDEHTLTLSGHCVFTSLVKLKGIIYTKIDDFNNAVNSSGATTFWTKIMSHTHDINVYERARI